MTTVYIILAVFVAFSIISMIVKLFMLKITRIKDLEIALEMEKIKVTELKEANNQLMEENGRYSQIEHQYQKDLNNFRTVLRLFGKEMNGNPIPFYVETRKHYNKRGYVEIMEEYTIPQIRVGFSNTRPLKAVVDYERPEEQLINESFKDEILNSYLEGDKDE